MRGAVFPKIGVMLLVAILLLRMVALLFALTCRKVLFVVTSEVIEGLFVDFDGPIGHLFEVFYDHLIIRVFLIVFVALGTHIASQIVDGGSYGMGVLLGPGIEPVSPASAGGFLSTVPPGKSCTVF